MVSDQPTPLAEPFSQIFNSAAEAHWAFDFLWQTAKALGLSGPADQRLALTLTGRGGQPGLHLTYGSWLVVGFRGGGQVELLLLAESIAWDERFVNLPFEAKEGSPAVRSYLLPLAYLRPMTSALQAAWSATLAVVAEKFHGWKRATPWKKHQTELVEALFDGDKRQQFFAAGLAEPELLYERQLTAFYHDVSEEGEVYETGEVTETTVSIHEEQSPFEQDKLPPHRSTLMDLSPEKVDLIVSLIRRQYPTWSSFSDLAYVADEINYKRATVNLAKQIIDQDELDRLIREEQFDEFIERLDKVGKDNNLLWRNVPASGDLGILYHPTLDKPSFCRAVADLLYGDGEGHERLDRYLGYVQNQRLPNKWTFPTYFLFFCHPDQEIFIKPSPTKRFLELLGRSNLYSSRPSGKTYLAIKQVAQQLKQELSDYQPQDMIDIQSVIWVIRSTTSDAEESDSEPLGYPFSQIFTDREEAEWAFDFLQETFERLGIRNTDDERFALTISGKRLRLNFCNWGMITFYDVNYLPNRVHVNLFVDQASQTKNSFRKWNSFAQEDGEPEISGYEMPMEIAQSLPGDLRVNFEATLAYIAQRFHNWERCIWRKQNIPEIAEAIFDRDKQDKLLSEGLRRNTLSKIENDVDESIELDVDLNPPYPLSDLAKTTGFSEEELARWVRAIERKGQAILYGPPGTGKTYLAEQVARHLIAGGAGFWELVQFHPAYAYEDFMQGIRPRSRDGQLSYDLEPGRFLDFCRRAAAGRDICVLIIDEINRANLARVFGELMYLLEYRDQKIPLAGGGTFQIPANVRLLGTMNTADRSIALVDYALRRRFAFLPLSPNYEVLRHYHHSQQTGFPVEGLITLLRRLNAAIDDEHYFVGISFFLREKLFAEIEDIWCMEIEPYLEELFFDQPERVAAFRWEKIAGEVLPST